MTVRRVLGCCCALVFLVVTACARPETYVPLDFSVPREQVTEDFELENWRRTQVAGFEIYTNASPERVHEVLVNMERFTELVGNFIFGGSFVRPTAKIYIFKTRDQYLHFASKMSRGHATWDRENASLAMYAASQGAVDAQTFNHELVHLVIGTQRGHNFPRWFHEGIAQFLGTATLRGDVATIGKTRRPPVVKRSPVVIKRLPGVKRPPRPKPISLARLLGSATAMFDDIDNYYYNCWLVVHYGLLSEQLEGPRRVEEFWRYVSLAGDGMPWREAFAQSFSASYRDVAKEIELHREKLVDAKISPQGTIIIEDITPSYNYEDLDSVAAARAVSQHAVQLRLLRLSASLLDLVLAEEPDDETALHDRVGVAASQEDFVLAERLIAQLALVPSSTADRLMEITRARLAHEQFRAVEDSKRNTESNQALVRSARDNYRAVLNRDPDQPETWLALGDTFVLDEANLSDQGVSAFERAIELGLQWRHHVARLGLAKLLIRTGRLDPARPHLDFLIDAYGRTEEAADAKRLVRRHY